jgi:hypothetical protein
MIITRSVGLTVHFLYYCDIGSLILRSDTPTLAAISRRTRRRGLLSKPEGRFKTLFNAFNPGATSGGKADELPMLSGYGKVLQGNQRQDKRNAAQRGFDWVQGLFFSG